MSDSLNIQTTLRAANIARQAEWDPSDKITLTYRLNELAGETGEACNVGKKIERERLGIRGSRDTIEHLAEELADVVICADLVAMAEGIDLDAAVVAKFNATSEKVGLKTRLVAPSPEAVPDDVRRLVIAARAVAFDSPTQAELRALDTASEAFASRVPWDDEPTRAGEIGAEYDAAAHCVTLADCPPGLFLCNGTLGFKSKYGAMEPDDGTNGKFWKVGSRADAYCADSGEYFWGGTSNHDDRAKLLVYPIAGETVAMVASHGPAALRAQPAREDARPADGMTVTLVETSPHLPAAGSMAIRKWDNHGLPAGTHHLCVSPDAALQAAKEALRHYCCSCEAGHCAMSVDDTDTPVDEQMCGRRASKALAVLEGGAA